MKQDNLKVQDVALKIKIFMWYLLKGVVLTKDNLVIFRTTYWLRYWAQLQKFEEDGEFIKVACCKLEMTIMQFCQLWCWCNSSKTKLQIPLRKTKCCPHIAMGSSTAHHGWYNIVCGVAIVRHPGLVLFGSHVANVALDQSKSYPSPEDRAMRERASSISLIPNIPSCQEKKFHEAMIGKISTLGLNHLMKILCSNPIPPQLTPTKGAEIA
uniref:Uncharacterized protein n=1 Tax=Oryza sativa subsp. japonica TaxID=39947 RepID=Q2R4L4_ORYSJ|nr:hypothetical protein LOC_Os11g28070 [Oryza sativa Japonica Group]